MRLSRNEPDGTSIPAAFCWTRFGVEAGERAHSIFERKEIERRRNGGRFLWGIGHSIRPSLLKLVQANASPQVLFSPMKSAPSEHDATPSGVTIWRNATGSDGLPFQIPEYSLVTSRRNSLNPRTSHYALVCECDTSIAEPDFNFGGTILAMGKLRNLMSGSVLGSSQVTSVVRYVDNARSSGPEYPVTARARLVYPYLIRLTGGIAVPQHLRLDRSSAPALESAMDQLVRLRKDSGDSSSNACQPLFPISIG